MTSTFLIFQILLSLVITIAVLLQKSSSIGLGAYSGSNESMFGAKGPAGFLAKFTFSIALLFIVNTLALGYFYNTQNSKSVVDSVTSDVPMAPTSDQKVSSNDAPALPTKIEETPVSAPIQAPTEVNATQTSEDANVSSDSNTTQADTNSIVESNTTKESNASN
jgi:preprotein translocase subunit SecG